MASTTPDIGRGDPVKPPPAPTELARFFPQLEMLEFLGQGGMGMVYKARQLHLDRLVALKILTPEASRDPTFADRFTREARALAKLSHPNIVAIHDFGQAGGLYYFIMEFVDGASLRQLEKARRLTPSEALSLVPKVCEALQYAHDEGVVHRDIKPGNILIDQKGRVKLADFGLAKLLGKSSRDPTLTGPREVMGTPHYMAPEQMERPQAVDHRADIYSLGVVLYEMLTGELPLGRFAPPSAKVQVDVRLDEVVLKSLEREPERRFQHIDEVKTQMEAIEKSQAKSAPPVGRGCARYLPYARPAAQVLFALGIALVGLTIVRTLILQSRVSRSARQLQAVQAQWAPIDRQAAPLRRNLAKRAEIEGKLGALGSFSTNRFLWGAALKTVLDSQVDGVELAAANTRQEFTLAPAQKRRVIIPPSTRGAPAQIKMVIEPGSATEEIALTIQGKSYGVAAALDEQIERFRQRLTQSSYFKLWLTNGALAPLVARGMSQRDPLDPSRNFCTFTIQCDFPSRTRP